MIKTPGSTYTDKGIASTKGTNNIAEYIGLIKALEKALELNISTLAVYGDSQLVIKQLLGEYGVKSQNIIPLFTRAEQLSKKFRNIRFVWISREKNKEADELSSFAYIEYQEEKPRLRSKEIHSEEIIKLAENIYHIHGYNVDIKSLTCTCPFFKRMNNYYLHKRSGIKIRCKHLLATIEA